MITVEEPYLSIIVDDAWQAFKISCDICSSSCIFLLTVALQRAYTAKHYSKIILATAPCMDQVFVSNVFNKNQSISFPT